MNAAMFRAARRLVRGNKIVALAQAGGVVMFASLAAGCEHEARAVPPGASRAATGDRAPAVDEAPTSLDAGTRRRAPAPAETSGAVVLQGPAQTRGPVPTPGPPGPPEPLGPPGPPGSAPAVAPRPSGAVPASAPSTAGGDPDVLPCGDVPERMACVPGGWFVRGTDDGPPNARPQARVWLQTYYIDRFEVTYAEYEACEAAGHCPRSGPRYTDFDHPDMPIQGVRWFDAVAFCRARDKTLPTEAQWEKAARGPDGRLYPWGDEEPTCERAILQDASGRACGLRKAQSKPEVGRPWDVGSRPAGIYGIHDMIGNSWEWVADWYSRDYAQCGSACLGRDPRGPCQGAEKCPGHRLKLVRGGSWYWDKTRASSVVRRAHAPSNEPFHHFGFRCARALDRPPGK